MGHIGHEVVKPINKMIQEVFPKIAKTVGEAQHRDVERLLKAIKAFEETDAKHVRPGHHTHAPAHVSPKNGKGPHASGDTLAAKGAAKDTANGAAKNDDAMDSFTAAGSTIHHTPTATAIGDDANTMLNVTRSKGAQGHDVIVHGDKAGNFIVGGMITHPQQIADAILSNPAYKGGPINLVTCHGACGAAQELGEILRVPINASKHPVCLDEITGALRERKL